MIETTQTVVVDQTIDNVWTYSRQMERWAQIMPGFQNHEIVDDDHSLWVLKIGVGAMVRTVRVDVTVDRWAGPEAVDFTFKLRGDPVTGCGTYRAQPQGGATQVELHVEVSGTGPMAPMWEAMGGPVLPKFAASFAKELKSRIEAEYGALGQTPTALPATPVPAASGGTAPRASIFAPLLALLGVVALVRFLRRGAGSS